MWLPRSSRPIWHGFFIATGFSSATPSRCRGRATSSPTRWAANRSSCCATAPARSAPSTMSAAIAARGSARPSRAMPIAWSAPITAGPTSSTARWCSTRRREFGVDKAELSLRPVAVEDAAGLLFVSLCSEAPPDFSEALGHHPAQDEAARHRARQDRPPDRLCGEGQLEARVREQPRVLPLPAQPQGIQHRGLRRAARHGDARSQPAAWHGRHRGARQQPLPVAGARRGRCHVDHDRRVVALPPHAGDGRLRRRKAWTASRSATA